MAGRPDNAVSHGETDGYATVTLRSGNLQATFAPPVGMVGCSLVHGGEQLLVMPGGLEHYAHTGSAAGIPFLYPWANRLAGFTYSVGGRTVTLDPGSPLVRLDDNGLPIHGLLAASPYWQLSEAACDDRGASLRAELDFGAHDDLLACFPFPHVVRIDVRVEGDALTLRTTVTPSGDVAVPICFGFHPYLRVPGAPREQWEIELPVRSHLLLDERMIPTGETEPVTYQRAPLADRTFDDGFGDLVPDRPFVAAAAGRQLSVEFLEGYPFAQVYSPPGAQFVCFEPMTAPANALVRSEQLVAVEPGASFTAAFRVAVGRVQVKPRTDDPIP